MSSNYYQQRKKLAKKLGNPRLLEIGLHDFRHYRITEYCHELGGNIFLLQDFTGHRDLKSLGIYVHMEKLYYHGVGNENFYVASAKTIEDASRLIAVGYEFVHEYNGVMLYRKHK